MSEDNSALNRSEYDKVLSFFKYLVGLATGFFGLLLTVTGLFFYSNMKDVREEAKSEATRVATTEAKARVTEAFDQKNINAMILSAAQEKVGTITDKLINQQLTSKLGPIQQRLTLIGQISESEMRMRMGFRAGLADLNKLLTNDPDIIRFGRSTLSTATEDYETRLQESRKRFGPVPECQCCRAICSANVVSSKKYQATYTG